MLRQHMVVTLLIPALCSLGIIIAFFVSIGRALKKFNCLDIHTRDKLLLLEYYMAAVRNLSKEELIVLGRLPDEEITPLNMIYDYDERIQTIRKKINPYGRPSPA